MIKEIIVDKAITRCITIWLFLASIVQATAQSSSASTEFEPAVKNNSKGDIFVIDGVSHNAIRHHQEAMRRILEWNHIHQLNK